MAFSTAKLQNEGEFLHLDPGIDRMISRVQGENTVQSLESKVQS